MTQVQHSNKKNSMPDENNPETNPNKMLGYYFLHFLRGGKLFMQILLSAAILLFVDLESIFTNNGRLDWRPKI